MYNNTSPNPIDTIYNEREQFIVIGLTGRTGSGCSTVADILSTNDFSDLALKEPKNTNFSSNEERKYQIVHSYASKHWHGFKVLSMADIILSFILESTLNEFISELNKIFEHDSETFNKLKNFFRNKEIADTYNNLRKRLGDCLNEKHELKREHKTHSEHVSEYDCIFQKEVKLLDDISDFQKNIRKYISKLTCKYPNDSSNNDENKEYDGNAYTYLMQKLGNQIRISGSIISDGINDKINMFALARRANDFIKAIRHMNRNSDKPEPTLIAIDAIRNPYEATYFQDRYSAFYLISINTDENERVRRLIDKNYSKTQIKALDKLEFPQKLSGNLVFTSLNISACTELSDIYLYNPREATEEKFFITELIVKYVTLMRHPGLVTPTSIERCMQIAYNAKLNSGCLSRQVGAVITDQYFSIKAVGWNSTPEGQVPCNLRSWDNYFANKDANSFSRYEIEDADYVKQMNDCRQRIITRNNTDENGIKERLNGRLYTYCFKDVYADKENEKNQVHTRSLHAEENAFLQIVKYGGEGIKGGNLFTTAASCVLCSKKAFHLGIKNIYYIDSYPDIAIPHILSFGDENNCPKNHLFYGAIGKAYTCLFTQRIAIKDELEQIVGSFKKDKTETDTK